MKKFEQVLILGDVVRYCDMKIKFQRTWQKASFNKLQFVNFFQKQKLEFRKSFPSALEIVWKAAYFLINQISLCLFQNSNREL